MRQKNKGIGTTVHGTRRKKDGTTIAKSNAGNPIGEYGERYNVWNITPEKHNITGHPAVFPEKLANDHIITWSNKGDIVLDPFMGSGTTGIVAYNTQRDFIGIEISKEYFELASRRIRDTESQIMMDI